MASRLTQITVLFSLACIGMATPASAAEPPSFNNDVVPVLTRFGCNGGGCHGKLAGQNGFRLSLRGYAPELDHATITREALGRRINAASPEESLLVRKAANLIPHGGGQRLEPGGQAAKILTDWIAAGHRAREVMKPRCSGSKCRPQAPRWQMVNQISWQ